jgi:pimeloyl-ACP methyl ester carboxylesterase
MSTIGPLAAALPQAIRPRFVHNNNGLRVHLLEAGFEESGRPCVVLLHGFPELAYSWRKIMMPLASAGFHVIAPDQRGYGRTTGWDLDYDGDLASFRIQNLVKDVLGLTLALGYRSVHAVVGHDFGSPVAAYCALIRPDVFRSVVLMSAPFAGPPALPFDTARASSSASTSDSDIHADLAALARPRKHYQWYYATRAANDDMLNGPGGVHAFLRAYYHHKSADWPGNNPFPLKSWTAEELAKLPTYYLMDLDKTMAETVAAEAPTAEETAANTWLPEHELRVYSTEYERTGFQGGLQWYRCAISPEFNSELALYSGRAIDVPSYFISGSSDWGHYQRPGALEAMQSSACTDMRGCTLVEGAGHWVQQEQPAAVADHVLNFLRSSARENGN